ncbi:methyltransferase domain-containing protein [Saccharothrix variisporea]|uniref:Protein-L-isoaspartate O-methyltransferase n=1 Tax=Saccharothrix variisporea TaxID=543527 RepID=A0A495X7B1_9PSEU|nr:methyltransferase domain-containing protein [Saccharothrix variisporea]RKT69449.1 protein-L-isoaspartate(D-aspartate) O-methyltransferase [Saccharothrix variisporea]
MTTTQTDWADLAAALADHLTSTGDLHDPAWAAAIAATPRHQLVPTAYRQQPDGTWAALDTAGADLNLAYSTTTLVTELDDTGQPVSSSTKPDLMVRMLELLDIHDGHRVLEIGTGTGYNAALLAHRLGDDHVHSVDLDPALVETARARLAALGRQPRLAARDGADGWPKHAPYDRIIATCSVPRIPWTWAEQTAPGALLLADLKIGSGAGNLVLLHRHPDRLEGRFTGRWAGFLPMRHDTTTQAPNPSARAEQVGEHTTTAPAEPWNTHRELWLLAALTLPSDLRRGYTLNPDTRTPDAATLTATDGSWCHITLGDAPRRVREGGPTPLWEHVETAWQVWNDNGRPGWERFGLTVTSDAHILWLDRPDNAFHTLSR